MNIHATTKLAVIIGGKLKLFDLFTRTKEKALENKDSVLPGATLQLEPSLARCDA